MVLPWRRHGNTSTSTAQRVVQRYLLYYSSILKDYISIHCQVTGDELVLTTAQNQQLLQLGFNKDDENDEDKVREFINNLKFDLFLITEHYDEGLVLLKRRLCLTLQQILYLRLRKKAHKTTAKDTKYEQILNHRKEQFREWSKAEYILYEVANQTFWTEFNKEVGIREEVEHFIKVLEKISDFHHLGRKRSSLVIQKSQWNEEFVITRRMTSFMTVYDNEIRAFFK